MKETVYWINDKLFFSLKGKFSERLENYEKGNFKNFFDEERNNLLDIGVTIDTEKIKELEGSDATDKEDACIIFNALEGMTPALACRPNLWYYLVHTYLLEYSRKRWWISNKPKDVEKMLLLHFLVDTPGTLRDDHASSKPWWTYYIASKLAGSTEEVKVMEVLNYFGSPEKRMQTVERPTIFGDLSLSRLLYKFVKLNPSVLEGQQPFRDLLKTINFSSQGFLLNDINEKEFKARFIDI